MGIKTGTHINKTKYAVYHMVICNTEKKIRQRDERQIVVKGWEERSFNFKYSCEGDWRRKRQPTPVFIPGKSHGPRSLVGYNLWGHKESDTTERLLCVCVCVKVIYEQTLKGSEGKRYEDIWRVFSAVETPKAMTEMYLLCSKTANWPVWLKPSKQELLVRGELKKII